MFPLVGGAYTPIQSSLVEGLLTPLQVTSTQSPDLLRTPGVTVNVIAGSIGYKYSRCRIVRVTYTYLSVLRLSCTPKSQKD